MIEEINDCADKGQLLKRKELLEKISVVNREIRAIETPISETDVEQQSYEPDWVDIENKKFTLEEKTTKELTEAPIPDTSENKESKDKHFAKILKELHTEAIPESRSRYTLIASIIFIISIIVISIFVGINSNNNNTLDTSNRTIPVTIPVNAIQQNPGSPIAGTWKFENSQGIVSTIIFDGNDNAIIDDKPFKYNIVGSNLILKDNKSSTALPYKLLDENNLLLKLRVGNYDNYVNEIKYPVVAPTPIATVWQSSESSIANVPTVVQLNEKNINHIPTIIDSNKIHLDIINNVLNKTDKSIINHINSITIIYGDSVECSTGLTRKAIGCAETLEYNPTALSTALSVDIRLVDKGFWQRNSNSRERACGSFEYTLNHEIGHVKGFMNNNESELYADTYASEQFILKNKTTYGFDGDNSQSAFERIESLGQDQCINSI